MDLAKALGVGWSCIAKWETGQRRVSSLGATALKLLDENRRLKRRLDRHEKR